MRAETVAKKKPNTRMISAARSPMGTPGMSHSNSAIINAPVSDTGREMLLSVRAAEPLWSKPFRAWEKVFAINGMDLIRLMMPPAATAPAPMLRIKLRHSSHVLN